VCHGLLARRVPTSGDTLAAVELRSSSKPFQELKVPRRDHVLNLMKRQPFPASKHPHGLFRPRFSTLLWFHEDKTDHLRFFPFHGYPLAESIGPDPTAGGRP